MLLQAERYPLPQNWRMHIGEDADSDCYLLPNQAPAYESDWPSTHNKLILAKTRRNGKAATTVAIYNGQQVNKPSMVSYLVRP